MARTISVIQNSIIANLVNAASLVGVTITPSEWSQYDYRQLISYVIAVAIATTEQLWDAFISLIEGKIAQAAPQTGAWFKAQMLKFQFSATDPQIIQFNETEFYPYYTTVNTALQVIKYCSVVGTSFGRTIIKVAAQVGGVPVDLDTAFPSSLAAAQSYADTIAIPGIAYVVQSGNSDKLYIAATIYYQGAYSAIIQTNVITAIETYLSNIPFDGVVLVSNLELTIKAVAGVNDVILTNVQARPDATAYGSGTNLVVGVDGDSPTGNWIQRSWATVAGYIVPETTATHTLADSLYFKPE